MLNGPISDQIKMNYGIGAMGPFAEPNAVIGRAWTIFSKNLGGCGVPGLSYLGTLGSNFNYNNLCIAETENRLPDGWKPFHVQKGFKPDESVVSIFSGWSLNNIAWFPNMPYHELIKNWLTHFFSFGTSAATVMLDPTIAREAKEKGFNSKEELSDYWSKNSKTPGWLYWDTHQKELKQAQARRGAVRLVSEDGRRRDSISALLPPRPFWRAARSQPQVLHRSYRAGRGNKHVLRRRRFQLHDQRVG